MALDLFTAVISEEKQHTIFRMMLDERYTPERAVIEDGRKASRIETVNL